MSTAAPSLHSIRPCLEGAIPAIMATCDPDGTPNVAYISQVVYVDAGHVALSFQFFNKTRQNILRNPRASVLVLDPLTAHFYRLHLLYERTEDSGPVFESMRAQLAGIASHSGMAEVFELKGADIYAVEHIESVAGEGLPAPAPRSGLLHTLRLCSESIARCSGLDELLQGALQGLQDKLGIQHAMVLMLDASAQQLYTVASCGYATSGVGSEIRLGQGVIGMAARERTPVRISHMTHAALYSHAIRDSMDAHATPDAPPLRGLDIPYPGLPEPHSQVAVPLLSTGRLLGVLFAESLEDMRFGFEDEDLLVAIAGQLAAAIDGTAGERQRAAGAPLCGQRQRVHQRRLPDQGRGGRHCLEAAARPPAHRARGLHQPRAAAGPRPAPARCGRQPGGPPAVAAAPPAGELPAHPHRKNGARALSAVCAAPRGAGRRLTPSRH